MAIKYQDELIQYCRSRLEELDQYRAIAAFFQAEHKVERYGNGLRSVVHEFTGTRNDDETRLQNVHWAMVSNTDTNTLFMPGVHAILSTGKPFLPKLLEIPEYWEQKAREEAEAERKRREEEAERHQAEMKAKWKEEEARQQERTKREVMKVLGITEKQLARIVEK